MAVAGLPWCWLLSVAIGAVNETGGFSLEALRPCAHYLIDAAYLRLSGGPVGMSALGPATRRSDIVNCSKPLFG